MGTLVFTWGNVGNLPIDELAHMQSVARAASIVLSYLQRLLLHFGGATESGKPCKTKAVTLDT